MSILDMVNQRKNPRLDCLVPVEGKAGSAFADTQTIDISRGGIGFISPRRIPVDRRIPIELDTGEGQDPILVIGRVAWTKAVPGTGQFRIGLVFDEALPGSKSRLNKYFKKT